MADYERELNWDDEISQESEFTTLPAGDYDFEVIKFERCLISGYQTAQKVPPSRNIWYFIQEWSGSCQLSSAR